MRQQIYHMLWRIRQYPRDQIIMGRYYFHILNGVANAIDGEGVELTGVDAATVRARQHLASVVADEIMQGCDDVNVVVMVDDAQGARVATLNSDLRVVVTTDPFVD